MPSRDDDGRELSGAEKRARAADTYRNVQREIDHEAEEADGDRPKWSIEFDKAGEPELAEVSLGFTYVRKLQMIVIKQMATTPFPGATQRETWKRIQAMAATIGMTHNKASIESEVKQLREMLTERQQRSTFVTEQPAGKVAKPPTARGQRRGGPRPIPQDALPPDEPTEPEGGDSFDEEPEDDTPAE